MEEWKKERGYSNEISRLRYRGKINDAIKKCDEAILYFPNNNFFYKLLGDLYVQKGDFENAGVAYIHQLKLIEDVPEQFKNFARFYQLLEKNVSEDKVIKYQNLIKDLVRKGEIPRVIEKKLATLFISDVFLDKELRELMNYAMDDRNLSETIKKIDTIKDLDAIQTIIVLIINKKGNLPNYKTNEYLVSVAEKYELYSEGLELIKKILSNDRRRNPVIIRTLFRICRKLQDYSVAESILDIDIPFVLASDFNIQYELVYYFEYIDNVELLNRTLKKMRNSAASSIPIARALYNFYLKFNRFDEAMEISKHIRSLEVRNQKKYKFKRIDAQFESEQGVWDKLQELVSEQEHNRQMIAMRDLLKGFSHELGQPITNIRYSVQLYQMKAEKGFGKIENIDELLSLILNQTERIGNLLARFRPIVSSKSKNSEFNVYERIDNVLINLSSRLEEANIKFSVTGNGQIQLWGDPVQFEQVFYNLVLNSMQAISGEKIKEGMINIEISKERNNSIKIVFYDNGPGVPGENTKKIFEPFYSTKKTATQSDGGEGLGLFIVWNVLKLFNGSIKLDTNYKMGAKFIISIKEKEKSNE